MGKKPRPRAGIDADALYGVLEPHCTKRSWLRYDEAENVHQTKTLVPEISVSVFRIIIINFTPLPSIIFGMEWFQERPLLSETTP